MVGAASAGSHPKRLHPNAVRVMREHGIDISGRQAKHLDTFAGQRFGYVVSLCDRVREVCPEFPGSPETIHWSIPDPSATGGSDKETYPVFRQVAADLRIRVGFLLGRIAGESGPSGEIGSGRDPGSAAASGREHGNPAASGRKPG